jgi:hypothetical protein
MRSLEGVRMLRVSTCGTLVVQYNRMQQHDVPYRTHGSSDLHGQLFDRPEHSPAEITELSPMQTLVEDSAYANARKPEST